jgi:hypothetical protein
VGIVLVKVFAKSQQEGEEEKFSWGEVFREAF